MKRIITKLDDLFVEISFAEERDLGFLRGAAENAAQKIEDTFTAIAFAEEGLVCPHAPDSARANGDSAQRRPLRPPKEDNPFLCTGGA